MNDSSSLLSPVDYQAPDGPARFVESLRETGFGVLSNHPLQLDHVSRLYENWLEFFQSDEKYQYHFNVDTQDGFFPATTSEVAKNHCHKDLKEFFHVYPWGQIPPQLRDDTLAYFDHVSSLSHDLLGWIEQWSPPDVKARFSMPLPAMVEGTDQTLLRVLHYPPQSGDETPGAVRAAAHEDINLITLLPASNEPGLQVKLRNGHWLDVPCEFGLLIVNNGDMLQEASGGYFPSTTHRVINPDGARKAYSRLSMPLFLHPRPEVRLSERYVARQYLVERLQELGVM